MADAVHDWMDSTDVLAIHNSEELIGVINQVAKHYPEIAYFPASPVPKTSYKTLVQTALPTVAFRAANAGREVDTPTLTTRDVDCKYLDASWEADDAVLKAVDWGLEAAVRMQQAAHIQAAFAAISSQVYYGVSADASGFAGLASLLDNSDDDMVVDAGGDTAGGCTSLFALRFEPLPVTIAGAERQVAQVCLCWGQDGALDVGDIQAVKLSMADGKVAWGRGQKIAGYVGLQATNYKCIGRICNIDSDHKLTDTLIASLLAKFPEGGDPEVLMVSKQGREWLRQGRTATNPTGAPAPMPESAFGIPLLVTPGIVNTEEPLTAAGT